MKKMALIGLVGIAIISAAMLGCSTISNIIPDPAAIEIKSQISMPLFYVKSGAKTFDENSFIYKHYFSGENTKDASLYSNGEVAVKSDVRALAVDGTWDFLQKSDSEKQYCKEQILATCKNGETPAIAFCLSSKGTSGPFENFPNVTDSQIDEVHAAIKDLVKSGIAVFPTLYVDDCEPRWTDISKHKDVWTKINNKIGKMVTAYVLSIETNDRAQSKQQIIDAINVMRAAMPGAKFYGTHMQFHVPSYNRTYVWRGSSNRETPENLDFILCEMPWPMNPGRGDAEGLSGADRDYKGIKQREPKLPLIWHEFNLNPGSNIFKQQRDYFKKANGGKEWGVG